MDTTSPFDRDNPSNWERLDWEILQNGPVFLYHSKARFETACSDLAALQYRIFRLDVGDCGSTTDFHVRAKVVLEFPDYYGMNLDAFNDSLTDYPLSQQRQIAIAIERFHKLAELDSTFSHAVLDVLARASRDYLIYGQRLVVLVQSDDPRYEANGLGGTSAWWNGGEWLNTARGL